MFCFGNKYTNRLKRKVAKEKKKIRHNWGGEMQAVGCIGTTQSALTTPRSSDNNDGGDSCFD